MSRATVDEIIAFMRCSGVTRLDVTGGAPELNANFRLLVEAAANLGIQVVDRCNLTVLNEPGMERSG